MVEFVRKNLEVRIYPTKMDRNDDGEKTASISKIESNIGITRFIYDKELTFIKNFEKLLIQYGYNVNKLIINDKSCNVLLKMLRVDYSFLKKAESSSRQQAQRDLINAFKRYYGPTIKSDYPVLKTKKKSNKNSFRIMNNKNVRITKDKNGHDKIKLAKLGIVKFRTSKEYRELLHRGSDKNDETVKIKHVTVKKVNGIYYAVFNIKQLYIPEPIIGPKQQVGIDIGCSKVAVLSNGEEIPNLDLNKETDNIIRYQKTMDHHDQYSIRYREAQIQFNKSWQKLLNKRKDYYNKAVNYIVKNSCLVVVQNENIIFWKNDKNLSHSIQLNAPRDFLNRLERKCKQEGVPFIKISKYFPSTQICSKCHKINKKISRRENLGIRDWECPHCHTHHDRDVNAAKNILNKGLQIVGTTMQ